MKAKFIIENGETTITLTPENEFDKNVVETTYKQKDKFNIHTEIDARYNYGSYDSHKIIISLKEIR